MADNLGFGFSFGESDYMRGIRLQAEQQQRQYEQNRTDWLAEQGRVSEARRIAANEARTYQTTQDDREWDAKKQELDLKKRQLEEVGIPAQKVEKWYREKQIELARDTLIEDRRQFDSKMGLDYLKTGASLSGPADYFQAADFARGVQARGELPQFLKELQSATGAQLAGGAYSQQPERLTMNSLATRLTGGGAGTPGAPGVAMSAGAGGPGVNNTDAALAAVTQIGMNPNKVRGVENLQKGEQKALGSGLGAAGFEVDDWLSQYKQGGVGFGAFGAAA